MMQENCYVLDKDNKCFIIDPGYDYEALKKEIEGLEVLGILLTHGHADHIGLIGKFNVPIYVHKEDDILLRREDLALFSAVNEEKEYYYDNLKLIYVYDGMQIPFLEDTIKVLHTPGHTGGSVCYQYKNKLFSGDTLFKYSVGRTDLPTGSSFDMQKSILRLIDTLSENTKVYPGHDENTTIKDEKQNNSYYLYYKKH